MIRFSALALMGFALAALPACTSPAGSPETVRVRWPQDPESLDPLTASNLYAFEGLNLLHTSLLALDDVQGLMIPWLAEALPTVRATATQTFITYRLRPEAQWDNGAPVLARDVAFTLKVLNCPGLPNEGIKNRVSFITDLKLDPTDPRRFTLVCSSRAPEYIQLSGDFFILPEYALDPDATLRALPLPALQHATPGTEHSPVVRAFAARYQAAQLARHPENLPGCGPYQLGEWTTNTHLTFRRKAHWWADALHPAPPQLLAGPRTVSYQILPDVATSTLALRRGDLDLYPLPPARQFTQLKEADATQHKLAFFTTDSYEVVCLGFNTRSPLLADKLTRQALSHLLDIPALNQATQLGEGRPTVGLINPRLAAYYNDSLPLLSYDVKAAALGLTRTGWQRHVDGAWFRPHRRGGRIPLSLKVSYRAADPLFEQIALQFQGAATRLGIPVTLKPTEPSLLTNQLHQGEFDLFVRTFAGHPLAVNFMPLLHSKGIGVANYTHFTTPATDRLIEAIASEEDVTRKARLLRKFQTTMQQESPLVPLFFLPYRLIASRKFSVLKPSGLKPGYDAKAMVPGNVLKPQPAVVLR